jgi:hypothetical protein
MDREELIRLAKQHGRVLADLAFVQMRDEGKTGEETAVTMQLDTMERVRKMIADGMSREEIADWAEAMADAYTARLTEYIEAGEALVKLASDKPN